MNSLFGSSPDKHCLRLLGCRCFAVVLLGSALQDAVNAATVMLVISGRITTVDEMLTSYYSPTSEIRVTASYAVTQAPNPSTSIQRYPCDVSVFTMGRVETGSRVLGIKDNVPYDEAIFEYIPLSGPTVGLFQRPELYISFVDETATIFSEPSIPNPWPSSSELQPSYAFISYEDPLGAPGGMSRRVNFQIDSVASVPEPSTLVIVAGGVAYASWSAWRRRKAAA
jgi:hypothetical protein